MTDQDNSDFAEEQIAQPGAPQPAPPGEPEPAPSSHEDVPPMRREDRPLPPPDGPPPPPRPAPPPPPHPGRPPVGYPGYQPYQQASGQVRPGAERGPHPGAHRADPPTAWVVPARPPQRADAPGWDPEREGAAPPPYWGDTGAQQLPARWTPAAPSGPPGVNWSYVDQIRTSELVPTRKVPPGRGWRQAVFKATGGLVNLGQSPEERRQAELEATIRTLLRGGYKIGVLGKGGVGKTTIAACVGSVFAKLRQEDRVVAIDADTAFGKLGSRIDPKVAGSYWELASDQYLDSFADVRSRVGANAVGLFVLAGEAATARRRTIDPAIYREAAARLDNHFTISIIDCGSTIDAPVTQEVLRDLDALIVVSSPWVDGASAAGQTMEWLANHGYTGLLHRTVVVLNDSDGHADTRTRSVLVDQFGSRGQTVIEIPYDPHLRPGGVIDVDNELNRITRRRVYEIAAAIAGHFPATTQGLRERR